MLAGSISDCMVRSVIGLITTIHYRWVLSGVIPLITEAIDPVFTARAQTEILGISID